MTKDDITKTAFCRFFSDDLVHNPDVLEHIEKLFAQYVNVPINDLNRAQAMVPSKAVLLENLWYGCRNVDGKELNGVCCFAWCAL